MIDLHFCPTPNSWKVAILLEETGLPYRVIHYDILNGGEHLRPEFGSINPNHKVPAIVDHDPPGGGEPFPVFESGAILVYLAEKTGQFMPSDPKGRSLVLQWLVWQVASLGPMYGQANHFIRYAREKIEYSITRYSNEAKRLTQVLENRLSQSEYIADDYSIADMATWPWTAGLGLMRIDIAQYPNVERWYKLIEQRPAVQRAFSNKETEPDPKYLLPEATLTNDEWSNAFGENMLNAVRR